MYSSRTLLTHPYFSDGTTYCVRFFNFQLYRSCNCNLRIANISINSIMSQCLQIDYTHTFFFHKYVYQMLNLCVLQQLSLSLRKRLLIKDLILQYAATRQSFCLKKSQQHAYCRVQAVFLIQEIKKSLFIKDKLNTFVSLRTSLKINSIRLYPQGHLYIIQDILRPQELTLITRKRYFGHQYKNLKTRQYFNCSSSWMSETSKRMYFSAHFYSHTRRHFSQMPTARLPTVPASQ